MADAKKIVGGLGKVTKALLADGEEAVTAAQRAEAGRKGAALIKTQPQVKASEALGQQMEKGVKRVTTTQADRTRVGGGNIGGAPFSAISEADPNYAGKVWGVMDEGTASRLTNLTDPETVWTTMLGSANQLKTNPVVFDKLKRQFLESMKQGNLSPELEAKINHNLALNFGEGANIRDPKIWRQADTFEKRAALADLMMGQGIPPSKGGVPLGGEKSGKGVIFRPTDTLKRETEPSLLHTEHGGDVPTFAAGPRLFKLEKESVYRPDLHPGFPTLLTGKDMNVNMIPTPTEIFLPDWHKAFKEKKPERFQRPWSPEIVQRRKSGSYEVKGGEGPGYYDLALGLEGEGLPSQALHDEYIRHLIREGFKDGGGVDIDAADRRLSAAIQKRMAKGGEVDIEAADARLADAIAKRTGMAEGGEVGFKKIQFMGKGGKLVKGIAQVGKKLMADEIPATEAAKGKTQVLLKSNLGPAFGAYGYTDDILRRERGSFAGNFGLDYGQKLAPSFEFVPIKNLKVTEKVVDAKVRSLMGEIKESGNTLDNKIPPVIVDSNGNVLDGHHRIEAARRLGYEQVPVIEKFDIQNGPQLGDEFADGGKIIRGLGKVGKKLLADAPAESKIIQAPTIMLPSKLSTVREGVRGMKGNYGAKRVERAADEIPNLEKMFQEGALGEAFTGDNARGLMTINPADFEKYAQELSKRTSVGPKASELAKQGEIDKYTVPTDEYIKYLQQLSDGFSDVPYLNLYKNEVGLPTQPKILGHEGRHRNRSLADKGETAALVQVNPRGDLREGMPRRTQEEFIEALKEELERSNRLVIPESEPYFLRPSIKLPDIYAKGGKIVKGGLNIAKRLMSDEQMAGQAIGKAAESAGMKAPVTANKPLTTTQDFHTSLGDSIRQRVARDQALMDSFNYKYDKGQRVFTEDSAQKNWPPMTVLSRALEGNRMMREDPNDFLSKKIIDEVTGKPKRTPPEPGYRVRLEHSPDNWSEFLIPESAIKGNVDFARGGLAMAKGGKLAALGKIGKRLLADPTAPRSVSEGDVVNGMLVRKDIPNTSSIGASLSNYSTHGLQEVPMSAFQTVGKPKYYSAQEEKRTKELARQIQENKELNPLIVVKDAEGHYILEGGHRFDALRELGIDSFPALMVHDLESLAKQLPVAPVSKAHGGLTMAGGGRPPSKVESIQDTLKNIQNYSVLDQGAKKPNELSGVVLAGASWMAGDEKTRLAREAFGEDVTNTAIGGQKTSDVLNQLNVFERDGGTFAKGTTVVLDIGANDIAQGVDKDTIRKNLNEIVSRLGDSGVNVILSGQPEASSYDEAIKSTNLQMDDLYNDIAKNHPNVTLVDAMSGMLNDKTLMDESGFHLKNEDAKLSYLNQFADAYKATTNKSETGIPKQVTQTDDVVDIPQEIAQITQASVPETYYTPEVAFTPEVVSTPAVVSAPAVVESQPSAGYTYAQNNSSIDNYYNVINDYLAQERSQDEIQAAMEQYGVSQADVDAARGYQPSGGGKTDESYATEQYAEGGGAFKKIQFMDKGGITTSAGSFSPEELGVSASDLRVMDEKTWNNIKRNAPEVYEWAKQNVKDEASQLKSARGVKDFALRTGAQYLGGIPDLVNLGLMGVDALADTNLSSEKPWFGSEQYIDALKRSGAVGENEFPIAETIAGVLAPASLIKKGIKKVGNMRPAKEAPKKRQGGLSAMAR